MRIFILLNFIICATLSYAKDTTVPLVHVTDERLKITKIQLKEIEPSIDIFNPARIIIDIEFQTYSSDRIKAARMDTENGISLFLILPDMEILTGVSYKQLDISWSPEPREVLERGHSKRLRTKLFYNKPNGELAYYTLGVTVKNDTSSEDWYIKYNYSDFEILY